MGFGAFEIFGLKQSNRNPMRKRFLGGRTRGYEVIFRAFKRGVLSHKGKWEQ